MSGGTACKGTSSWRWWVRREGFGFVGSGRCTQRRRVGGALRMESVVARLSRDTSQDLGEKAVLGRQLRRGTREPLPLRRRRDRGDISPCSNCGFRHRRQLSLGVFAHDVIV